MSRRSINSLREHEFRWPLAAVLALACLALLPRAAAAAGGFSIGTADAHESGGVYYLDASISYELNETALDALDSGVALTFELRIEVHRERRWRPDKNIAELLQLYELQYHALSQRYIVRNLNSGDQDTYLTLTAALQDLGTVRNLPLLDAALLRENRDYLVRLKAVLDIRSFPGPLRLLSGFFGDWRLASRWYEFGLQPP